MDYQHIAAIAGPEAARKIDKAYCELTYTDIDPEQLDDLTRGAVILGTETIDYPLTDGMIIYLKRPAGDVISVVFDVDTDDKGLIDQIKTRVATVQEGGT